MSMILYDEALLSYLKRILQFDNIINSADTEAWDNSADEDMPETGRTGRIAEVKLPMVSFWRTSYPLENAQGGNWYARHQGRLVEKSSDNTDGITLRSLDTTINYQITIWSDKRYEVDDIFCELLMHLCTDHPQLEVNLSDDITPQKFNIQLVDTDTSPDVTTFDDKGRVYVQHIMISIDEAKIFFRNGDKLAKDIPIHVYAVHTDKNLEEFKNEVTNKED